MNGLPSLVANALAMSLESSNWSLAMLNTDVNGSGWSSWSKLSCLSKRTHATENSRGNRLHCVCRTHQHCHEEGLLKDLEQEYLVT